MFTVVIWAINGLIWLKRQNSLSKSKINFDYLYDLDLTALSLGFDKENDKHNIQVGLKLRNSTSGPLEYYVETFDVILGDKTIPKPNFKSRRAVIPHGATRT